MNQTTLFDWAKGRSVHEPTDPKTILDPACRAAFLLGKDEMRKMLRGKACTGGRWENVKSGEWFRPFYLSESGLDEWGVGDEVMKVGVQVWQ